MLPPNRQLTGSTRVEPYMCFGCRRYMCDLDGPHTGTTPAPTMLTNGNVTRPFCAVCAAMAETISNSGYFTKLDTEQKELRGKVGL